MEFLEGKRVHTYSADETDLDNPRRLPKKFGRYGLRGAGAAGPHCVGEGPGKASAAASGARGSVSEDEGAQQFAKPLGAAPGEFLRFLVAGISAGEPGREVGYQ